ncbi:MAG TPA: 2Fe-2S iron-sulfur cluster-binding protein [Cytophagales bacterium]|nr:2Fe-2S iron-sulfur cluster-binding protein [Cytophagales bacterium]
MFAHEKNITITVISSSGRKHVLKTFRGEYRNLMMLIYDQCYEDIGECKGIALCGTCHVQVLHSPTPLDNIDEQEKETLSNLYHRDEASRLSCQIMVDERINGLIVKVMTETGQE